MAYESWREQVEEGEQRARQAEIGNVFLIDRGRSFLNCESRQLWRLSYLLLSFFAILNQTNVWKCGFGMEFSFKYNNREILVIIIADIILMFSLFADVDLVTPLCSQVVYEGLVDDIFRIKCGKQWYLLWLQSLLWNSYTANNVVFIYCVLVKDHTHWSLLLLYTITVTMHKMALRSYCMSIVCMEF